MTGTSRFQLSAARLALLQNMLAAEGIERAPAQVIGRRADPAAPVPLTFPQNRLWFLDRFAEHTSAYVISAALRVRGDFRLDVFARACAEVVRRHESLRTVFGERDGHPFQQVRDELPPEVGLVDLPGLAPEAVVAEVGRREAELVARPFDLATGPLLRVELLRLGPADAAVILNLHHIVSDRWSMGVLMRELIGCYRALVTATPVDLPELPVQYPDFALWQQGSSFTAAWEADLAYWTRQLRRSRPEVGLATDRRRPKEKSYRGSSVPVRLPATLVAELRALARTEAATPFMVLAAAYAVVLSRLGDSEDVVVGTPVANRTVRELEPLIGLFVNTLALRVDLTGNPTFRELLRRVSRVCLDAYDHQSVPFERLVEQLQPQRSLAHTPVFGVMLSYQNVPFPAWQSGPVQLEPIPLASRKAEFDLLLDLFEDGETIWGRLEYSVDIFDETSASRLVSILTGLLRTVTTDPDRPVRELPLLGAAEWGAVLAAGTGPVRVWPQAGSVPECIQTQVRSTGTAVAVWCAGVAVSYAELNRRANRLARGLRDIGVGPGAVVGVSMVGSVELVVALLGVWKAGGAFLPLEPTFPAARLGFMVQDAGTRVVLTQRSLVTALPAVAGVRVLPVEDLEAELVNQPDEDPPLAVGGADLACVTYTSGHAGRPAGVLSTHAALLNRLLWMQDQDQDQDEHGPSAPSALSASDRVLCHTPLSSDGSVWELCWPLMAGATLVLADPDRHTDPRYLVDTIRSAHITTTHVVVSMLELLLQEPDIGGCTSLRQVLCSGEPLRQDLADRFRAACPAQLYDLYGPAEAAPLGHPIANTQIYVLDRWGQPVGFGVAGELHIGGANLARGYLHRPDLTADRFVPDPFGTHPGGRLYRTGELGRLHPDGVVEYLGRLDHRVSIRGQRVELDEVETLLAAHPLLHQALVVAQPYGLDDLRLVAYLTGEPVPAAGQLLAYLRQHLPDYMLPAMFVALPAIPRTPHGTVDRARLPALEIPEPQTAYVAPATDTEHTLAALWQDLLGVDRVGTLDSFFDLGGHSLLATKLVAQVATEYRVSLPLRVLFDNPTVAGLAAWLREQTAQGAGAAAAIPVVDRAGGVPLSFAQERLCRDHPLGPQDPLHNVVTAVVLRGRLDEPALRRSLDDLVRRHEALRTRIVPRPSGWVQLVEPTGSWPLAAVDLRASDEATRAGRLRRLVEDEGRRPFRIAAEPLVRGTLVATAPDEHVVVLVMHHLVTDNWSYGVLVGDLCELYESQVTARAPRLPALGVGFADVAAWQQRQLADGALHEQVQYWRRQLADLPPRLSLAAPTPQHPDGVDPATGLDLATGYARGFRLDTQTRAGLAEIGRREGATLFMVLMAAFDLLLSAYSGRDDIVVSFPEAGRERPETAHLVGYLVTYLVVRADLSGGPSFRTLVSQVRRRTVDAYAHQGVPLWSLDEVRGADRDPFRVVFNLLNASVPAVDLYGLRATPLDTGSEYVFSEVLTTMAPTEVDLALIMREDDDGHLRGTWLYSLERVDARVMAMLMGQWPRLVSLIVAQPDLGVDELRRRLRE